MSFLPEQEWCTDEFIWLGKKKWFGWDAQYILSEFSDRTKVIMIMQSTVGILIRWISKKYSTDANQTLNHRHAFKDSFFRTTFPLNSKNATEKNTESCNKTRLMTLYDTSMVTATNMVQDVNLKIQEYISRIVMEQDCNKIWWNSELRDKLYKDTNCLSDANSSNLKNIILI